MGRYRGRCVCLNVEDVERVAVETTGVENLTLRFTGLRPMLPGLDRRWNDTMRAATRAVLRNRRTMAGPVLTGHLAQQLAEAVLGTFPSTRLATRRRVPPDHATPAVVRRAVDFIDANAEREVTVSDIAAAAGIGPRGLQAAFLRHQDSTPTAYLRRVRLTVPTGSWWTAIPPRATPCPPSLLGGASPGRARSSPLTSRSTDAHPARPGPTEGAQCFISKPGRRAGPLPTGTSTDRCGRRRGRPLRPPALWP